MYRIQAATNHLRALVEKRPSEVGPSTTTSLTATPPSIPPHSARVKASPGADGDGDPSAKLLKLPALNMFCISVGENGADVGQNRHLEPSVVPEMLDKLGTQNEKCS